MQEASSAEREARTSVHGCHDGERFCNESVPYDYIYHAATKEKLSTYCMIFGANWREQTRQFHTIGCSRMQLSPSGSKYILSTEDFQEFFFQNILMPAGICVEADTIEGLAEKLLIPADALKAMDAYPMSHQRMGAEFVTAFDVQQTEEGVLWSPNDLPVVLAVNDDGVYVTADGTPFKTEDIHSKMGGFSGSMGSYYLGSRYYVAYSASQLRAYAESGIPDTTMGFQNTGEGVPARYPLGDWLDTVLEYAVSRGWAWKVSTLSEGDKAIGLPEGTLEAAYAADATALNHADDEFYCVMACTGLSISSCGGIEVNERMQAVRGDGSAIENLFVVGNDSFGNIMSTGAEYSIGGDAGMWCMGSADVAAKTAVQMIQAR